MVNNRLKDRSICFREFFELSGMDEWLILEHIFVLLSSVTLNAL